MFKAPGSKSTQAPKKTQERPEKAALQKRQVPGQGYDEQAAALSPRLQHKEEKPERTSTDPAKTGDEKPKFDQWNLTPEVQALFVELKTADEKRQEAILNELTKSHGVPKGTIEAVIDANKKWYATTWDAIKGGSWHTVGTAEDGTVTYDFKLDGKGLAWANPTHKVDVQWKDGVGATYEHKEKEIVIGAGYNKASHGYVDVAHGNKEDGLSQYHVEAGADGGSASYKRTKGEESHEGKAGLTVKDGQYTATGQYEHVEGKDKTTYGGTAHIGEKKGGELSYSRTRDGETHSGKAGYDVKGDQHTATGTYTHTTKDKESTSVSGKVLVGEKDGGELSVGLDRRGYKLDAATDASVTEKDGTTTTTIGGSTTYTDKGKSAKDGKKPEPGEGFTVKVDGRYTATEKQEGDASTKVNLGSSVQAGNTTVSGKYMTEGGTKEGTGFRIHEMNADFGQAWDLDKETLEKFSLNLGGALRLTDLQGEEGTYTGYLSGIWQKGKGDDKELFSFKLSGGHETLSTIGKSTFLQPGMLGDTKGYGNFGQLNLGYGKGLDKYELDLGLGGNSNTTMAGLHFGYDHGTKHEVDLWASVAKQDSDVSAFFKATSKFALSNSLTLSSGGQLLLKPGDQGYDQLWSVYTGLGIQLRKDMSLTLKMGVASDGQEMYYVPEAMYEWKDKLGVGVMGNFSGSGKYAVGGKLTVPKADLTLFGGYGDPSMLTNPYAGSSGMTMPGMTGNDVLGYGTQPGGFVGVSWNALPTIRKVFGIK